MMKANFPRIICKDGATLSVQASQTHYATPREDKGPYTAVEVGFPSITPPESWAEYAESDFPSDVYGWVPLNLVEEYITLHGGIDWGKTLDTRRDYNGNKLD